MHETAIATNLLEHVLEVARRHGAQRVDEVEVEIGVLQQVVPEALELAFAAATEGTLAHGAGLKLILKAALAECRTCGQRFEAAIDNYLCPTCQHADVRIVGGNDIVLKTLICQTEACRAPA